MSLTSSTRQRSLVTVDLTGRVGTWGNRWEMWCVRGCSHSYQVWTPPSMMNEPVMGCQGASGGICSMRYLRVKCFGKKGLSKVCRFRAINLIVFSHRICDTADAEKRFCARKWDCWLGRDNFTPMRTYLWIKALIWGNKLLKTLHSVPLMQNCNWIHHF